MKTSVKVLLLAISAATVGSAPAAINVRTVKVDDAGNPAHPTTGLGAVAYPYYIGTYEVTNAEYAAFLNAVAATDPHELYSPLMARGDYGGIDRSGSSGSYRYAARAERANKPVNCVSFWCAARFANWLTNGQPVGPCGPTTTETGCYNLNGVTNPPNTTITRDATAWANGGVAIANVDEWCKAAFYQPAAKGGDAAGYWLYPTATNTRPGTSAANPDPGNNANYTPSGFIPGNMVPATDVGEFEHSSSYYGTFDQAGNVWEWLDTAPLSGAANSRVLGGGASAFDDGIFQSTYDPRGTARDPISKLWDWGFRIVRLPPHPLISAHPATRSGVAGENIELSVGASGDNESPLQYQWYKAGVPIPDAVAANLPLIGLSPAHAGIYDVAVSIGSEEVLSRPAVVGVIPPAGARTVGNVTTRPEWQNIVHPNGNVYDQFLLDGPAGTFTPDPGEIARCSSLDPNGSIVQVEMSGAGAVTIVLAGATGPATPQLYNQAGVQYMKGKATVILAGADETTHVSIYSVGPLTNPGVVRPDVAYRGWADIAAFGVTSTNGRLGGIHQGNVGFNANTGFTGIYAPTVHTLGSLIVVHDIAATDTAIPYLYFAPGGQIAVKIAGGGLAQPNGEGITVSGLSEVTMGAGQASTGALAPAQAIQTALVTDDQSDVTGTIVVEPSFVIARMPSHMTVGRGGNAAFHVEVRGAGLTYQWYQGESGDTARPISGATTATLVTLPVRETASYWVRVQQGAATLDSATATVSLGMGADAGRTLRGNGSSIVRALGALPIPTTTPTAMAQAVTAMAAGEDCSLFVTTDGKLWGLGSNLRGRLGLGGTGALFETFETPAFIADGVVAAATGWDHSVFIKADGSLWAMGNNAYGQLGDGTTTTRLTPVKIADNVAAASVGTYHSLFLTTGGVLMATGSNTAGQLGDGTQIQRNTPVRIADSVASISAGAMHSIFVKTDGSLWAMGLSEYGRLGGGYDGYFAHASPRSVGSGAAMAVAGGEHSLVLKRDGTLWATGRNDVGQLGAGDLTNRNTAVQIASGVASISAGLAHSLFLKIDGSVWGMGENSNCELGDGSLTDRNAPVRVADDAAAVAAGSHHSLLLSAAAKTPAP